MTNPIDERPAVTVAMARCPQCQQVCSATKRKTGYAMSRTNCRHAISAREEGGAPVMRFAKDE